MPRPPVASTTPSTPSVPSAAVAAAEAEASQGMQAVGALDARHRHLMAFEATLDKREKDLKLSGIGKLINKQKSEKGNKE